MVRAYVPIWLIAALACASAPVFGPARQESAISEVCRASVDESSIRGNAMLAYKVITGRAEHHIEDVSEDQSAHAAPLTRTTKRAKGSAKVGRASVKHKHSSKQPKTAGWFGAFSDGESTFDADGLNGHPDFPENAVGDAEPGAQGAGIMQFAYPTALPPEWFSESRSGGPDEAWQTYYPELSHYNPRGSHNPPWRRGRQDYDHYEPSISTALKNELGSTKAKQAEWFDGSVRQFDAFGRGRLPSSMSARSYLEWERRVVNTTLKCPDPGCIANGTLQVYDPLTELHRMCRLTITVHATDFDDDFSQENVEWFKVNNQTVNAKCDPMAKFCNNSVPVPERPMYPCVTEFDLDKILEDTGSLAFSGKISPMVDECPADGNLLSALATVECFIRLRPDPVTVTPPPANSNVTEDDLLTDTWTASLQCAEPACTAQAIVEVPIASIGNKTCLLNVVINQTDFDGDHGSTEEVEWVSVDGSFTANNTSPGRNPCKERLSGDTDPADVSNDTSFALITDMDVTQDLSDGNVVVSAKLSEMVDECGVDGFLLNGIISVTCT